MTLVTRIHRRVDYPGGQERALWRIGGLAGGEETLDIAAEIAKAGTRSIGLKEKLGCRGSASEPPALSKAVRGDKALSIVQSWA